MTHICKDEHIYYCNFLAQSFNVDTVFLALSEILGSACFWKKMYVEYNCEQFKAALLDTCRK